MPNCLHHTSLSSAHSDAVHKKGISHVRLADRCHRKITMTSRHPYFEVETGAFDFAVVKTDLSLLIRPMINCVRLYLPRYCEPRGSCKHIVDCPSITRPHEKAKRTDVIIHPSYDCRTAYNYLNCTHGQPCYTFTGDMICTTNKCTSCYGDYGAPLMEDCSCNGDYMIKLIGVRTFSLRPLPIVYGRVSSIIAWILKLPDVLVTAPVNTCIP